MSKRFSDIDYESSPKWEDVVPIAQNEGTDRPLAAITYSDEYAQATSYLRAVMASNEKSERVLELTEHIINLNPGHYTVWLYRASTLAYLSSDPHEELRWAQDLALVHLKNYQIWSHREKIMSHLSSLPSTELPFLSRMLSKDMKNYHVWSYRQWLVRHFALWPEPGSPETSSELKFTEALINTDVRNNSAWNHRFFVLFGREAGDAGDREGKVPEEVWEREVRFAEECVARAPQNAAAWNYLTGVLRKKGDLSQVKDFALRFADVEREEGVRSSFALDVLAEIWAEQGESEKAKKALELLGERYDPIRKNYWSWRAQSIDAAQA